MVFGAGPIGTVTALAAVAGGCAQVFICDLVDEKLAIAAQYDNVAPVNLQKEDPAKVIREATGGWGADVVFECAGAAASVQAALDAVAPAGCVVWVGMPVDQGAAATSIPPMGSLYEAMMFLSFEILVLDLRDRLAVSPEAMRANHTNLE